MGRHDLDRYEIATINRLRSSHINIGSSLYSKKLTSSAECKFCGEAVDDLRHYMFICPRFKEQRKILFETWKKNGMKFPNNIYQIIKNLDNRFIKPLLIYIKNTRPEI